jgi:hypothetical protein
MKSDMWGPIRIKMKDGLKQFIAILVVVSTIAVVAKILINGVFFF